MSAPVKKKLSAATQRIMQRVKARMVENLGPPNDESFDTPVIEERSKPVGRKKSAATLEPDFTPLPLEVASDPASVPVSQDSPAQDSAAEDSAAVTEKPSLRYGVYALVNLKGGVGRTTSAMHLAAVVGRLGLPVVVLEPDSEQSAKRWATAARHHGVPLPFDVMTVTKLELALQARALSETHVVIIDAPSHDRDSLIQATRASDQCIIVVSPSRLDVGGLASTYKALYNALDLPSTLEIAVLVARCKPGTQLTKDIHQTLEPLPVLIATIGELEGYEHSFGQLPTNLEEYQGVWDELHQRSTVGKDIRPGFRAREADEGDEDSSADSQLGAKRRLN